MNNVMANNLVYPTPERIIEYNVLALELIKAKKKDKPSVMSYSKVVEAISKAKNKKGNIYDKATVLLHSLVQGHPFASGNRRTAFIAVKYFLLLNNAKFGVKDDPLQAKTLLGVREGYYTHDEIKEWIKNGKIREFRR